VTPARRIVALGGGHGLAATLRAVRTWTDDVVAVVSVADDGGSSGRLRSTSERPAPGDLRKAVAALAAPDSPLAAALEHRFEGGELEGHAFGNLLLAALSGVAGDPVGALDEAVRLTGGVGRVLPATVEGVVLVADTEGGGEVTGQVNVMGSGGIERVRLAPADPDVPKEVVAAIEEADVLVLGPGSLYTSVLAAAVVPTIREALVEASAPLVYVCNLHPQEPESAGMGVAEHVAALARHGIEPDVVLYDPDQIGPAPDIQGAAPARLARANGVAHDPDLLGAELRRIARRLASAG
jgi:uncharacterized cofD-like protein